MAEGGLTKDSRTRFVIGSGSRVELRANSSLHPVKGSATAVTGEIRVRTVDDGISLDPAPSGFVEVPVGDIRSGNLLQDRELRRRVDAKRFPTIRFDLSRAEESGDVLRITGDLSFHGRGQRVVDDVSARLIDGALVVEGSRTFDIRHFGLEPPRLAMLRVHPEVVVRVKLVARPD